MYFKKQPFLNYNTDKYDNEKCTFWEFDELNKKINNNENFFSNEST